MAVHKQLGDVTVTTSASYILPMGCTYLCKTVCSLSTRSNRTVMSQKKDVDNKSLELEAVGDCNYRKDRQKKGRGNRIEKL